MATETNADILKEILNWTRVGFYVQAKTMLGDVLNSENKRRAYQLADGTRSQGSIRAESQIGSNELTDLFRQCVKLGLMEEDEDGKRRRIFDLVNFGLWLEIEAPKKKGAKK